MPVGDGDVDGRLSPRAIPRGGGRGPGGRGRGGAMDRNTRGGPMMRGRSATYLTTSSHRSLADLLSLNVFTMTTTTTTTTTITS